MKTWNRIWMTWALVIFLVFSPLLSPPVQSGTQGSNSRQQDDVARQKAINYLQRLTPEERVGQLFVVTMQGSVIDSRSQIYDLIANYHVGGVMLQRENDNFNGEGELVEDMYALTTGLQDIEWESSQGLSTNESGVTFDAQYVPLLIGLSQEGDGFPNDQLLSGITELPSLMSVGATWSTLLAGQVGAVMGQELAALGVNFYLGPSLDVLDLPPMESGEDLGVRTFGGDPYWVGKMGQAYIAGLHAGSQERLAVIAKHFPGRGGSDRSPEEEIATVRKSLDRLKAFELAPFSAVTGNAPNAEMAADGLLVSHIRYQGFQGNIRATTKPVSFDKAALDLILNEAPFTLWRDNGGIVVSDDLGSQAVRRFYETSGSPFDALQVAREAVFAGNDLLYVDRFAMASDPDTYTTTVRTLEFFTQKYRTDPEFARRVDTSVERILTLKFGLYPEFEIDQVLPDADGLENVGQGRDVTTEIARRAVTLISPNALELTNVLPDPPQSRDRIVFLTDIQPGEQCSNCPEQVKLPVDALQSAVLRLYGTQGTRQVSHSYMSSYSFADLWTLLGGFVEVPVMEEDLLLADWVVVALLNPRPTVPNSQAFRYLLSDRPELLRDKKVIVFAFNAPYYLDATDISKVTAYYGLYSKSSAFVEVAARALFQEAPLTGALPVSVPGVGYDLINATSPDSTQVIPLFIDDPTSDAALTPNPPGTTAMPTAALSFRVDDVIPLRTGVIYDYNRNPVPDDTPVSFLITIITENGTFSQQIDQVTVNGVSRLMYRIEQPGVLDIRVTSGQGASSGILRLNLSGGEAVPTFLAPSTQTPSPTPEPTFTPSPTITPTATPTPIPVLRVGFSDWFFVILLILSVSAGISWLGIRQAIVRWGLRWALCGVIGGLLAYNYVALNLPGSQDILSTYGTGGVVITTFLGMVIGWGAGLLWHQFTPGSPGGADRSPTGERRSITGPKT
jgi:beta-N-acetylhexosaminidase